MNFTFQMSKKVLIIVLVSISFSIHSKILHVPAEFTAIQSAINASSDKDTVLVSPGIYYENINFRGKNIVLTSVFYVSGSSLIINTTVINGSKPNNSDTGSCVIFSGGEDSTAILQGFTITGGSGTKWNDEHGAGMFREGGGILVQSSSPVIQNNVIVSNSVTDTLNIISTGGGGIRIANSFAKIYNNLVMNNTSRYGAGIVLNFTGGELRNNMILGNFGSKHFGAGSGIWINGEHERLIKIINNTIAGNSSAGGICGIYGSGTALFKNNIVWGNVSPTNVQASVSLNMSYSVVQGGYQGTGIIDTNPFEGSSFVPVINSVCIDSGDPDMIFNDKSIPDGNSAIFPSLGNLRNDIGAFGGPFLVKITSDLIMNLGLLNKK
ncbi:MAG: hypothetical protein HOP31_14155 [Ignavibacteria bacterium]|nr:hypothetical protein [Ignavibacteria bacterium]